MVSWSGDQGVATVAQGVNWGKLLNALQDQQVNNWGNNDTGMGRYERLYSEDWQRDSRTNEASRPHSCTRLFLMPLVQQGREATPRAEALGRASLWKDLGFLFSWKEKKACALFFLFFQRKDPLSLAFLYYLISFLRSKVTHTGSILEVHSASNAHTLLAPMGIDPHLSRLVTSITKQTVCMYIYNIIIL